jgi:glutathione peroxidase
MVVAVLASATVACEQKLREPEPASNALGEKSMQTIHDFEAKDIDGKLVKLDSYAGKVLLIVNVASKCGFTPQYRGLEALYQKHRERGLAILGFPCDQFGNQEPGTEAEIKQFCSTQYEVSFPIFSKIEVNGPGAHPLYRFLRAEQRGNFSRNLPGAEQLYSYLEKDRPDLLREDSVRWNFTKFLVDRQGRVVKRFESVHTPEAIEPEVVALLSTQ